MIFEVTIDEIDIEIPLYAWLLGRMSDEEFKKMEDHRKLVADSPLKDRHLLIDFFEVSMHRFRSLPLLLEKVGGRYKLRDGHRRLVALVASGAKTARAKLKTKGMTKMDWEGNRLIDCMLKGGLKDAIYPQHHLVKGEPPFCLRINNVPISSFMISTGVRVPYALKRFNSHEERGADYEREVRDHIEFLVGVEKHEEIVKKWGTQPFNTYLLGHFPAGPDAENDPLVQQHGRFVRIQQYFRGGYWGKDVPGYPYNGVPTVIEQCAQNNIAIPVLFKLGILKPDTKIYFADQSADKPCPLEQYFKLFSGEDCLKKYYVWLPTYFRTCRATHFNIPIEKVIECIP